MRALILFCLFWSTGIAWAQPSVQASVKIQAMQVPAWILSGDERRAAFPGATLTVGDRLETGSTGRILLWLPESSALKLGPESELELVQLRLPNQSPAMSFDILARLARGTFRFTTSPEGETLSRRVSLHLPFVQVGVRGTDFLGQADTQTNSVALLEGQLALIHPQGDLLEMNQAQKWSQSTLNGSVAHNLDLDTGRLIAWAQAVEMQPGTGSLSVIGRWVAYLGAYSDPVNAVALAGRLNDLGYPARIEPPSFAQPLHRVVLPQFVSREDAEWFRDRIAPSLDLTGVWVGQR